MRTFVPLAAATSLVLAASVGGQEHRETTEMFLRTAHIERVEDVGEGVTKPLKVELLRGDVSMSAIFKDVDTFDEQPYQHNGEASRYYIDSYKAEIAAYELDKALGFGLLPAIVERKVKGRTGSLREWVEDVRPRFEAGRDIPSERDVAHWTHTVWLLDYLIYNVDRGPHNIMVGSRWAPVVIDNSMCFNTFVQPIRPLSRFPRRVIERIRAVDRDSLDRLMAPWLRPVQTEALWHRMQFVAERVSRLIDERGEAAVFLEASAPGPNGVVEVER